MTPFLSIIIPIYKIKESYLRECLDSLLAQDMRDFQIIAVDDGSPDQSGDICDEYAQKDERVIVIHQENAGVSVARNAGIKAATTEWITFVDPDDWVESNHVSTLYNAQKKYNDFDIFWFDYVQEFDGKSNVKYLKDSSGCLDKEWVHNLKIAPFNFLSVNGRAYEYETNTIWNKMYRASLLKDNEMWFDPKARKGQDVIFNAECLQLTDKFYYIHSALYHYRYLQESVTNRFNEKAQYYNEVAFENYERIIKKFSLPEEYWKAYYARVLTRLYSCMRLFYFHPENKMSRKLVNEQLNQTLDKYPYNVALKKVDRTTLTQSQRIFVFFLKKRAYLNRRKMQGLFYIFASGVVFMFTVLGPLFAEYISRSSYFFIPLQMIGLSNTYTCYSEKSKNIWAWILIAILFATWYRAYVLLNYAATVPYQFYWD